MNGLRLSGPSFQPSRSVTFSALADGLLAEAFSPRVSWMRASRDAVATSATVTPNATRRNLECPIMCSLPKHVPGATYLPSAAAIEIPGLNRHSLTL